MGVENGLAQQELLRFANGERHALRMIRKRFDGWLDYHNSNHTARGIEKTGRILTVMNGVDPIAVPERDIHKGRLFHAFHDFEQNFTLVPFTFGSLTFEIMSHDPKNEDNSAHEGADYMVHKGFGAMDIAGIYPDIACTIAEPDPEFPGSFYQPNLTKNLSFISLAGALADLGCAGMEGPDQFYEDGVALFREQFVGVHDLLVQGGLSSQEEEDLKKFMIAWLRGQAEFAKGRKERTVLEIGLLPEEMRGPVQELFPHFDQTISMAEKLPSQFRDCSLTELAVNFGYNADGTLFA